MCKHWILKVYVLESALLPFLTLRCFRSLKFDGFQIVYQGDPMCLIYYLFLRNLITLKAHCRVRPLFLHALQSCPCLSDHVEIRKGIYCTSPTVATNDVDNIWNYSRNQQISLMKKHMNAINGCAFMKTHFCRSNSNLWRSLAAS